MAENRNYNLVCVAAEGFLLKKEFVCKEFSLFDFNSNFLYHTTIKSPQKASAGDRQQILCETSCFGLEFDSGDIEIDQFIDKLLPMMQGKRVIVQHPFIANWLKEFFSLHGVIDCVAVGSWFEEGPCMNDGLEDICHYHNSDAMCAPKCTLFNVLSLKKGISVVLPHLKDLENTFCIGYAGFNLFDHGYIFKEICLVSLSTSFMFHTTIKPPKRYEKIYELHSSCIKYETQYGNGLEYDSGEITFNELIEKLLPIIKGKKVLVKNYDQIMWLNVLFKGHCNFQLIETGGPRNESLTEYIPNCAYHPMSFKPQWKKYCAMRIATVLKKTVLDLFEKTMK